uniref:Transposase n=1 Tax=Candidatus Kentrum sp. LFY TaxID=2126342 RepID=A0A450W7V5_9GAMM|nr:MAG: Transposase [Candidatus Kentron sp. LFY]
MPLTRSGRSDCLTIVMDLASGAVVEVAQGGDAAVLVAFWRRLEHSRAKVETVAIRDHSGILAYYGFDGFSTGPLEGTDNRIKALRRVTGGLREMEFLELKIKALPEEKYAFRPHV